MNSVVLKTIGKPSAILLRIFMWQAFLLRKNFKVDKSSKNHIIASIHAFKEFHHFVAIRK